MLNRIDHRNIGSKNILTGLALAAFMFLALGTIAALWKNPFFVRMTPAGDWEIGLLAVLSMLSGLYIVVRRPFCTNKTLGAGAVLGFLGVACPVCNKILVIIFGGELLLAYYEPVRIHLALIGILVTLWAIQYEWRKSKEAMANTYQVS